MKLIIQTLLFYLFFVYKASAYLDPGTGSILIQSIIAVLATISMFFRNIKHCILSFFCKSKKSNPKEERED